MNLRQIIRKIRQFYCPHDNAVIIGQMEFGGPYWVQCKDCGLEFATETHLGDILNEK